MIQVTEAAIQQIKEELKGLQTNIEDPYIRLHMGLGWGGPRLQLALEESSQPQDEMMEVDGIKFLVHANHLPYFNNVKLDYTKNLFGLGEYTLLKV